MRIAVLTGSPHKQGTSALLTEEFIRGAREAGHEVIRFDAAFETVHPCLGCDTCRTKGSCVWKDSMEKLNPELILADAIVFATPVYYFGVSAQLKTVIDRFYAPESKMIGAKKTMLLATAYNPDQMVMEAVARQYQMIVDYMKWNDKGMILACGCGTREQIEMSAFPKKAYELGKNLK